MATVLLYGLSGKDKLKKIRFILFKLGISAQEIDPGRYDLPLGALVGLEGFPTELPAADAGQVTDETAVGEMLVMCGLSSPQFSALLNALRQERVPVALKAMLTETNAAWSSRRLYRELQAEHEALSKVRPKDAAKNSRYGQK